jgi:hypothetical protein
MPRKFRKLAATAAAAALAALGTVGTAQGAPTTPAGAVALNHRTITPAVLTAGSAEKPANLTMFTAQPDAYYWVNNFKGSADTLTWTVSSDEQALYSVTGLLATSSDTPFVLKDDVNGATIAAVSHSYGWDRLEMGQILVPKGVSHLTLSRTTSTTAETDVKSLELVPTAKQDSYTADVASAKANSQWLTDAGYGLFFQYGAWGYPPNGLAKTLDQQACDFNVPAFVDMVKSTGAAYVMWSYTWYTYQVDGPNAVIDRILGNGGNTAACDLDLKVAQSLHKAGIKFILYYHNGHDQDPTWWAKQQFPAGYRLTGTGDKTTFLTNWKNVISWAGDHFGRNLDGWWFDDGAYYYPADFKSLQSAARAGNPNRIVTWNTWIAAAYTKYEDFQPGETCNGSPTSGSVVGPDGVYLTGPYKGIRAHCAVLLNQDWGVHDPNTTIRPTVSTQSAVNTVRTAMANHTALSLDLMMYEDGTVDPTTLATLKEIKAEIRDGKPAPAIVNDNDPSIGYTGASWALASNRNAGDIGDDVKYTRTDGESFDVTFSGTGIDFLGPRDPGNGAVTMSVDGGTATSIDASGPAYAAAQVLYRVRGLTPGVHHLVGVKAGGAYLQVDAFQIYR